MTKPDPDKLKGPGGLTLRQIHEQVKLSTARDQSERFQKKSAQTINLNRWQRFVHYVWDRNKGKS
ncbi:hypothetical protein EBAPG3_006935 [Nitrosospira lacus]|uniref:Uncharacterized protein n=1 Tax=Nitrosospira lacus TaxID=1288494 RepID=A0A1W6SNZ2_9PROT|nr:hypothetical protein [Nitrosospira lacus]ARO87525.1 hypothetical protein EBAPG3_006935 [Nitrosospira lacus]